MSTHLSDGGVGIHGAQRTEYGLRAKLSSLYNRRKFLLDCLEEQVLPRSAPTYLNHGNSPFSTTARHYLEEAREQLFYEITETKAALNHTHLPHHLVTKLQIEDRRQRETLQAKLVSLCDNSKWKTAGNTDLLTNISSHTLTAVQREALSLGLKFATGKDNNSFLDYVIKNNRWDDSDIERGLKQGIIMCCTAAAANKRPSIPRRYTKALEELRSNNKIIITTADKGGGVVIMDTNDYIDKMKDLLADSNTYNKQLLGHSESTAEKFNKEARCILRKTMKGKKLLHLLEEAPRTPTMRGLPKIHKPDVPLRPITSGIGSAPHRLAKALAAPLSSALGKISSSHLKNSSDLQGRLQKVNFKGKRLVSFDVKSLFTNVPVEGALDAVTEALGVISDDELPVCKSDYEKLISMCVKFGAFQFNGEEYWQHEGLAMGSPLSAVMASLYMEVLERDHYLRMVSKGTKWFRYVDDVLVITHYNTHIDGLLQKLNRVNKNIQFTVETEKDGKLPFLDTLIIRSGSNAKFKVYRKPTNKNDFVHYLSAHDKRTKTGTVIGFFLRALRICSPEFLSEELGYIRDTFTRLGYPKGLLHITEEKARKIILQKKQSNEAKYLVVPHSNLTGDLRKALSGTNIQIVAATGRKVRDLVSRKSKITKNNNSVVYEIPCNGCDHRYYGESSRGLETRLKEHKADIKHHREKSALVNHVDEKGHLPKWADAKVLKENITKQHRKAYESIYITLDKKNLNKRTGDIVWAEAAAQVAAKSLTRSGDG